jgi:tripartite-type tricarboxylate transporter receptor subunit TctC
MGRPLVAPPDLDARVARLLREAFAAAMNDPELLAESARTGLEINFVGGNDVQALVGTLYQSPPAVVARAQAIASAK